MITIQAPTGNVTVRADRPTIQHELARSVRVTQAGVHVIVGDAGWNPATLTLRVRVTDPAQADAVNAWQALLAAARAATGVQLHDSVVPVHGLVSAQSRHLGTWWDVTLTWLPAALTGARGDALLMPNLGLVINGEPVTINGEQIVMQ